MIKKILFLTLLLVVALAGVQVALNRGLIKNQALAAFSEKYVMPNYLNARTQLAAVSERLGVANKEGGAVLGTFVQVNQSSDKSFQDKAFEYGRYLYCQQVVKEYDATQLQEKKTNN